MTPSMTPYVAIFILIIFPSGYQSESNFQQEGAKVIFTNPRYVQNVSIFTYRAKRNSPYLTTMNGTTLCAWGNNLTLMLEYANIKEKAETFMLEAKLCEVFKFKWAGEFLQSYTNVIMKCPIPAKTYYAAGFELPPRNFPFPFSQGDYNVKVAFVITGTKERIADFQVNLRFQKKTG